MYIDAHSHLDRYDKSLETALEQIGEHRIFTLSNSMDLPSYERNLEIAGMCELVLPTFGIHPWNATQYIDHLDDLEVAIEKSPIIGEIGLDYHFIKDSSQYPAQLGIFEFFLQAARDKGKIVNIHTKGAERDVMDLLRKYRIDRVIIHWYSGSRDIFRELVDFGAYFTIGISILRSKQIQSLAREIPADRLLTETDNPGGWEWSTGEPGMPSLIEDVVDKVAEVRVMSGEAFIRTIQDNFARLVRDNPYLETQYARFSS
jgi:TatD DNase family protein